MLVVLVTVTERATENAKLLKWTSPATLRAFHLWMGVVVTVTERVTKPKLLKWTSHLRHGWKQARFET